jgi:hypothetical protein
MPKTNRYKQQLQEYIFFSGSQPLTPNGGFWVEFYSSNPGNDPEKNTLFPITWQEGQRLEVNNWSDQGGGKVDNLSSYSLTNSSGATVTVRYLVLWDSPSSGNSYFVDQLDTEVEIEDGEVFTINSGDLSIEEY